MFRIGITGGMGSGKSTVAKIFEVLGIPVYYADDAAKRLMNEDPSIKEALQSTFGKEVYKDGQLDRKHLSSLVFNNAEKLELLNAIVHPVTILDAEQWMQRQSTPYAIKEAALIFESGAQQQLDKVMGVHAPEAVRLLRVMKRDGSTREEVKARMDKQMDESIKMRLCDYVIDNSGQSPVIPQVLKLHDQLVALSPSNNAG